jgi:hypothetical protein
VARDSIDVTRGLAIAVSVVLVGATLSPLVRSPDGDSFPLSTYPMFATSRPVVQTLDYALGETATGERRVLDPSVVGTGEVLQAEEVITRAIVAGPAESARLCGAIAARVATSYPEVVTVRLVTGTHDAIEYLVHGRLGREGDRARCAVPR